MKTLRLGMMVTALGVASVGFASFDLMLLPGINSSRIHRVDSVSGVPLGSYASGVTRLVTLDTTNRLSFSIENTRIVVMKYDTGEIVRTVPVGGDTPTTMRFYAPTNKVFFASSTTIRSANVVTGQTTTHLASQSAVWSSSFTFGTTFSVVGINSNDNIVVESFSMVTGASIASEVLTTSTNGVRLGTGAAFTSSNGFRYGVFSYINNFNALVLGHVFLGVNGEINSDFATGQSLTGYSTANVMPSAVAGHSGFFLAGQDSTTATATRINQYDSLGPFFQIQSYTVNNQTQFAAGAYQAANVVAPEPATWCAMALGAGWIARRRRQRT